MRRVRCPLCKKRRSYPALPTQRIGSPPPCDFCLPTPEQRVAQRGGDLLARAQVGAYLTRASRRRQWVVDPLVRRGSVVSGVGIRVPGWTLPGCTAVPDDVRLRLLTLVLCELVQTGLAPVAEGW